MVWQEAHTHREVVSLVDLESSSPAHRNTEVKGCSWLEEGKAQGFLGFRLCPAGKLSESFSTSLGKQLNLRFKLFREDFYGVGYREISFPRFSPPFSYLTH